MLFNIYFHLVMSEQFEKNSKWQRKHNFKDFFCKDNVWGWANEIKSLLYRPSRNDSVHPIFYHSIIFCLVLLTVLSLNTLMWHIEGKAYFLTFLLLTPEIPWSSHVFWLIHYQICLILIWRCFSLGICYHILKFFG